MPLPKKPELEVLRQRIVAFITEKGFAKSADLRAGVRLPDSTTNKTLANQLQRLKMDGVLAVSLDGVWRLKSTPPPTTPPPAPRFSDRAPAPRRQPPAAPRDNGGRSVSAASKEVEKIDTRDSDSIKETPTTPGLAADDPSPKRVSIQRAQDRWMERLMTEFVAAQGGISIKVHLVLTPREVLELADRLPQALQAAAALLSIAGELEERRAEVEAV